MNRKNNAGCYFIIFQSWVKKSKTRFNFKAPEEEIQTLKQYQLEPQEGKVTETQNEGNAIFPAALTLLKLGAKCNWVDTSRAHEGVLYSASDTSINMCVNGSDQIIEVFSLKKNFKIAKFNRVLFNGKEYFFCTISKIDQKEPAIYPESPFKYKLPHPNFDTAYNVWKNKIVYIGELNSINQSQFGSALFGLEKGKLTVLAKATNYLITKRALYYYFPGCISILGKNQKKYKYFINFSSLFFSEGPKNFILVAGREEPRSNPMYLSLLHSDLTEQHKFCLGFKGSRLINLQLLTVQKLCFAVCFVAENKYKLIGILSNKTMIQVAEDNKLSRSSHMPFFSRVNFDRFSGTCFAICEFRQNEWIDDHVHMRLLLFRLSCPPIIKI